MSSSHFFKLPDINQILGASVVNKLEDINPFTRGAPMDQGHCQWAAIEATKVLLNKDYEVKRLASLQSGEMDPIEEYLGKSSNILRSGDDTDIYISLTTQINKLANHSVLIINGERSEPNEMTHAYVIYKKNDTLFLIDADRGVFSTLGKTKEDWIQPISGGKGVKKLDYSQLLINPEITSKEGVVSLSLYEVNEHTIKNLPEFKLKTHLNSSYNPFS